jgi:hypothetical protein
MIYTEACGCKCTDSAWIEMCPACRKESDEISARWKLERTQVIPIKIYRLNGQEILIPLIGGSSSEYTEPVQPIEQDNPIAACI